jgi:hypothetical protein
MLLVVILLGCKALLFGLFGLLIRGTQQVVFGRFANDEALVLLHLQRLEEG